MILLICRKHFLVTDDCGSFKLYILIVEFYAFESLWLGLRFLQYNVNRETEVIWKGCHKNIFDAVVF